MRAPSFVSRFRICRVAVFLLVAASVSVRAAPLHADDSAPQHPPIPVRFKLDKPGFVTLVIDDSAAKRVRNLISETPFPAGDNVAWWDGTDDLGRDTDAARHGVYRIPAHL